MTSKVVVAGPHYGGVGSAESVPSTPSDECHFTDASHPDEVLLGLNNLRKQGHFCDVSLEVEGQTFPVHKTVIASFSSYFRAMFISNLAESQQEHITLSGVDASSAAMLLEFAYTSSITINLHNVQSLLSASNLLEITSVRTACCAFLERHIDSGNAVGIHCFAEAHACLDLAEKAKSYTLRNFSEVVEGEEWFKLPQDKVIELISDSDLDVQREEIVYNAVSAWLHHSYPSRAPGFHKVLEHVRLPLVSPYYLVDIVESESAVRTSPECRLLIDEAKQYHLLPDRRNQQLSSRTMLRKNTKTSVVIVAVGGEDNKLVLRSVECYDPHDHCWRSLSCLPFAVSKHGLVASGDNMLYLAGGEFPDGSVTRCHWRYDPVLNEWQDLAPMHSPRSELGLIALDGCLYAVGGWNGTTRLSSVECYNPHTNTWNDVAPMTLALTSPAVTAVQGKLFVCGGAILEDGDGVDHVQIYDPHTNTWDQLSPMIIPRSGSAAAVVYGTIYVIGGWHASTENTNKVEKYDLHTSSWQPVASMNKKRYRPGVSVVDNKIFILGGEDGWEQFHDTIECYDTTNDTWTIVGELLTGRSWLSCAPLRIKKEIMWDGPTPLS